jgi:hypothetical protein
MKRNCWIIALAFTCVALAQNSRPPVTRSVVAGGGTTLSSSNRFQLSSTAGQPTTDVLSGNRFSIRQGFWIWRAPALLPASKVGTNLVFSLQTEVGKTYAIQYSDSLASPAWQNLLNVTGDGSIQTMTNAFSSTVRFFRVVEP